MILASTCNKTFWAAEKSTSINDYHTFLFGKHCTLISWEGSWTDCTIKNHVSVPGWNTIIYFYITVPWVIPIQAHDVYFAIYKCVHVKTPHTACNYFQIEKVHSVSMSRKSIEKFKKFSIFFLDKAINFTRTHDFFCIRIKGKMYQDMFGWHYQGSRNGMVIKE